LGRGLLQVEPGLDQRLAKHLLDKHAHGPGLRRAEPDIPTRGEMLRRLVERAKAAQAKAKKEN